MCKRIKFPLVLQKQYFTIFNWKGSSWLVHKTEIRGTSFHLSTKLDLFIKIIFKLLIDNFQLNIFFTSEQDWNYNILQILKIFIFLPELPTILTKLIFYTTLFCNNFFFFMYKWKNYFYPTFQFSILTMTALKFQQNGYNRNYYKFQ